MAQSVTQLKIPGHELSTQILNHKNLNEFEVFMNNIYFILLYFDIEYVFSIYGCIFHKTTYKTVTFSW